METVLLMLDVIAMAALVFTGLKNDRLPPGAPKTGPFRYTTGQPSARQKPGAR